MKKLNLLSLLLLIAGVLSAQSQQKKMPPRQALGLGLGVTAGCNGYGMRYVPSVYYTSGRDAFRLGALVQKSKRNLSGFELRWEHMLIKQDTLNNLELFTFVTGTYNNDAYLCYRELQMESVANLENRVDVEHYRFRSLELFAGMGLNWHFTDRLQWINAVGLGGYHTLNLPGTTYYSGDGIGLVIRSEIALRLNP